MYLSTVLLVLAPLHISSMVTAGLAGSLQILVAGTNHITGPTQGTTAAEACMIQKSSPVKDTHKAAVNDHLTAPDITEIAQGSAAQVSGLKSLCRLTPNIVLLRENQGQSRTLAVVHSMLQQVELILDGL